MTGRDAPLHAIAYASTASRELTPAELDAVVAESRSRNAASGVTGVLLYCDGSFMHYLEGPPEAVAAAFGRILASSCHHDVNELLHVPIQAREFADRPLGFSCCRGPELLELLAGGAQAGQPGPGRELLQLFWRNCRR